MKKRIETTLKLLQLEKETVFTMKQLKEIAKKSKCDLYQVMYYLRFER